MNPFCNMCFKAGKSEKEYKSHWLRDRSGPDGVVVCPYLLSIECRYCHEKGHTVSRCPVLANKKKRMQYNQYCVPVPLAPLPPLPPPPPLVMPVPKKEVQVEEKVQVEEEVQVEEKVQVEEEDTTTVLGKKRKMFTPKMSWADMCDSDVEDDEF